MSLVNTTTVADILARDYATLSRAFGSIMVLLCIALLVQRELLRASGEPRSAVGERALTAALVPLLLATSLVIVGRFAMLLFP